MTSGPDAHDRTDAGEPVTAQGRYAAFTSALRWYVPAKLGEVKRTGKAMRQKTSGRRR